MTEVVSILIFVGGVALACGILVVLYRGGKSMLIWLKNSTSPAKSYPARVLGKRTETSGQVGYYGGSYGSVETYYFITFEFKNGERREYQVSGEEFGLAIEGDQGFVTAKGSRYEHFERKA